MLLKVSKLHSIDLRSYGYDNNPLVLYCHGGPGAIGYDETSNYLDLDKFFFVSYDQRGCGQSIPFAEIRENTTQHLVEDINKILKHYGKKEVIIIGDSWGTTLALKYAMKYPNKVKGLILGGLFLGRDKDIKWLYEDAPLKYTAQFKKIFKRKPTTYKKLLNEIRNKDCPLEYIKLVHWEEFLFSLSSHVFIESSLLLNQKIYQSMGKIGTHYFLNNCFLEKGELLSKKNLSLISEIPIAINHGIHDRVCLIDQAVEFSKKHQNTKLFKRNMRHFTLDDKYNYKIFKESFRHLYKNK